jgi:hypothetical protein
MPRLLAASAITIALSSPAFAETRSYDFKAFTKIDISAAYEVIFTQSNQRSLTIESDDFSKITVRETGDTLKIGRPDDTRINNKRTRDIVRISAPDLDRAELNAGVKFLVDGLQVDTLDLDINAGVDAEFRRVNAKAVRIDASAGVNIDLDGTCETIRVDASAGVDVDASRLRCRSADVDAGVGSSVKVHSVESVKADAGMGASIVVSGGPKSVDKHVSLGGSVSLDR